MKVTSTIVLLFCFTPDLVVGKSRHLRATSESNRELQHEHAFWSFLVASGVNSMEATESPTWAPTFYDTSTNSDNSTSIDIGSSVPTEAPQEVPGTQAPTVESTFSGTLLRCSDAHSDVEKKLNEAFGAENCFEADIVDGQISCYVKIPDFFTASAQYNFINHESGILLPTNLEVINSYDYGSSGIQIINFLDFECLDVLQIQLNEIKFDRENPQPPPSGGPVASESSVPTEEPSANPTELSTNSRVPPPDSLEIIEMDNSDMVFKDVLNIVSYTTFCVAGEYTSVQIVGEMDKKIYCITNSEGAEIMFGYEQDFPDRPIIKLDIEPPTKADCESITEDESVEVDNYCGFLGKPNHMRLSKTVNILENDDELEISIADTASYTTYCNDGDYAEVEIVGFDGTTDCIINLPGATTINLYDPTTGSVLETMDLEILSCETTPESRNVTSSFPCAFGGLATTEYVNFFVDGGNTTALE